jgi:hypothetical protein
MDLHVLAHTLKFSSLRCLRELMKVPNNYIKVLQRIVKKSSKKTFYTVFKTTCNLMYMIQSALLNWQAWEISHLFHTFFFFLQAIC